MNRFNLPLLGLVMLLTGFIPVPVRAETETLQSIRLHPSATEIQLLPGASMTKKMTIVNKGSAEQKVQFYARPYRVEGKQYTPFFNAHPTATNAAEWVTLGSSSEIIKPQGVLYVDYTVSVPANTKPGGYYAVIFTETQPKAQTGVGSHGRVGNILYITVGEGGSPHINASADTSFRVSLGTPITIKTDIENSGATHTIAKTETSIATIFGGKVFQDNTERYVLPGTTRSIETAPQALGTGIFKVDRRVTAMDKMEQLDSQVIVSVSGRTLIIGPIIVVLVGSIVAGLISSRRKTIR